MKICSYLVVAAFSFSAFAEEEEIRIIGKAQIEPHQDIEGNKSLRFWTIFEIHDSPPNFSFVLREKGKEMITGDIQILKREITVKYTSLDFGPDTFRIQRVSVQKTGNKFIRIMISDKIVSNKAIMIITPGDT